MSWIKKKKKKKKKTRLAIVPSGLAKILKPVDLCTNQAFKAHTQMNNFIGNRGCRQKNVP